MVGEWPLLPAADFASYEFVNICVLLFLSYKLLPSCAYPHK